MVKGDEGSLKKVKGDVLENKFEEKVYLKKTIVTFFLSENYLIRTNCLRDK